MNTIRRLGIGFSCVVSLFTVAVGTAYGADTKEEKIELAMSAGPAQVSENATIMDMDGTILREGSNGWTCMPSISPELEVPMCSDATWMAVLDAVGNKAPFETTKVGISYMLGGDAPTNNEDPFDTTQDPGESWVTEGPHLMIIAPHPEETLEGMSNDPNVGGPYIMWKNTPYAHIMVPLGPRE
ncbi:hypothetical protein [Marinobacter panjinensis]|uniref:hypothetical protein n=1 Tax=Marinobacter panjinensis TaxID=2576384 RepID=UPI00197FCB95|nr:hypothetical protein [Marinobacter panjinensis]MCR8915524.1 hypothetical protein [Marinobacter panjinensis]